MEHGIFHIAQQPKFLHIRLVGSFNQEGAIAYVKAMKSALEQLEQSYFALLFDITQFEGATPEAYEEIEACNIWLNTKKMVAKATVIQSRVQISIVDFLSPSRKQQNTESFYHHDDAQVWLSQELAKVC